MTRLAYSPRAIQDLQRLQDFLIEHDPGLAVVAAGLIGHAIEVLKHHPMIGRPAEEGLRELVISRGRSGYLALYDYLAALDAVVVLAVRHQREAGYEFPEA